MLSPLSLLGKKVSGEWLTLRAFHAYRYVPEEVGHGPRNGDCKGSVVVVKWFRSVRLECVVVRLVVKDVAMKM
jgi:hypothetical protein